MAGRTVNRGRTTSPGAGSARFTARTGAAAAPAVAGSANLAPSTRPSRLQAPAEKVPWPPRSRSRRPGCGARQGRQRHRLPEPHAIAGAVAGGCAGLNVLVDTHDIWLRLGEITRNRCPGSSQCISSIILGCLRECPPAPLTRGAKPNRRRRRGLSQPDPRLAHPGRPEPANQHGIACTHRYVAGKFIGISW